MDFSKIRSNQRVNEEYNVEDLFLFFSSNGINSFRFYNLSLSEDQNQINLKAYPKNKISHFGNIEIKDNVYDLLLNIIQ